MKSGSQHKRISFQADPGRAGFVIDLRPKAEAGEIKPAAKSSLIPRASKPAPDLLQAVRSTLPSFRAKPKSSFKLKLNFRLPSLRFNLFRRRPAWRSFVRRQEKLLGRAFRPVRRSIWERLRPALPFALVLVILILPLKILSQLDLFRFQAWKENVLSYSQAAIADLMTAADSVSRFDLPGAESSFSRAGAGFLAAQSELNQISDGLLSLAALSGNPELKLAAESKKFVAAGALSASLGRNLVLATDSLFNTSEDMLGRLEGFSAYGRQAALDAASLSRQLEKINIDNLPAQYQSQFSGLQAKSRVLSDNLSEFVDAAEALKQALGLSQDKRYLLVFQNNAEMRASGGFIGSYALLDFSRGEIKRLEVPGGGSYDTEAGLKLKVAAPEPLWLVGTLWHFWDANWWPDWPTTARNLMWFYEKSDGPTVDGVIGLTPTVVERLLEITGPIDLQAEYGLTVTADNFWETVQTVTEQKNLAITHPEAVAGLATTSAVVVSDLPLVQDLENNAANKPKKIIGDLMAKIFETLPQKLDKENLLKAILLLEQSLREKHILFYFADVNLQSSVSRRNWAGEVKATGRDYLMVVHTNIAGQKSDRQMSERLEQESRVASDGSIINTLKIYRTHTGAKNAPLTGVRNVDWLRIYLPLGSQLLNAEGFRQPDASYLQDRPEAGWLLLPELEKERQAEIDSTSGTKIYEESGLTVLANWLMVDPGETALVTISYRLPFNFFDRSEPETWTDRLLRIFNPEAGSLQPHTLLIQKQPGAEPSQFSSRLFLPAGTAVVWQHPDQGQGDSGWDYQGQLDGDAVLSILVSQDN